MNAKGKMDQQFAIPKASLPKGGGALSGIGEKFQVNAATGTASFSVPLKISPGRDCFQPEMNLSYDSGNGNGVFGLGWQVSSLVISRKTQRGIPQYRDELESDTFLWNNAEDLVPLLKKENEEWKRVFREEHGHIIYAYRPRVENSFSRIERWWNKATKISHWRVINKANQVTVFGSTSSSRIHHPEEPTKVFQWLPDRSYDDKGNCMLFEYKQENKAQIPNSLSERNRLKDSRAFSHKYLKRIKYGNTIAFERSTERLDPKNEWLFEVVFDYGEHGGDHPTYKESLKWDLRRDPFSSYRSGFEIRKYRLCERVLMFHHFKELGTEPFLVASTVIGYEKSKAFSKVISITQRSHNNGETASLPPLTFKYTAARIDPEPKHVEPKETEQIPGGVDGQQLKWIDLYGEGLSGILYEGQDAWWYKRNFSPLGDKNGPSFQAFKPISQKPSLSSPSSQLVDIDGDGSLELLVQENGLSGFFEQTENGDWESFKPFPDMPNINWNDPNLKQIDLSGDGHADLLITEENCISWYGSKAKNGYSAVQSLSKALDEDQGPDLLFADATQSIYIADMSGDGLNDIVRIRNGEVSYWPNLGYGHFGQKVVMENAPLFDQTDQFEQRRIKIGDIDGSGTTDIVYLQADTIRYWSNQSGNAFAEPQEITHYFPTDTLSNISVIDLLGKGTSCIVCSHPNASSPRERFRYIDLMADGKPHLLSEVNNNIGAITKNYYTSSTKFYLEAERNGKPWISKLPFPVHVLEKTELIDEVEQTLFSSRYAYHHGYYDRYEREFRGFGLVEQWDTEDYEQLGKGSNVQRDSFVPPVYTKTWIHSGFYKDKTKILAQYEQEYYQGDSQSWVLADMDLPDGLSVDEIREAHRALKGTTLRQEVYALDGSSIEKHPYSVASNRYELSLLQPKSSNSFAAFLVIPIESITYHYEREPNDPRIQHQLTLETDHYGTALKTIAISYPRRQAQFTEQAKLMVTAEEQMVKHLDTDQDHYRLGIPLESTAYELTGINFAGQAFSIPPLKTLYTQAEDLSFEQVADENKLSKRQIAHQRYTYYNQKLNHELPQGEVASHALPFRIYKKAFTAGLIASVFQAKVSHQMLAAGGYVLMDGDWWHPSDTATFSAEEFYQVVESIDPFGNRSKVVYDDYALFPIQSIDALNNTVSALYDYRLLSAQKITDPNNNWQEVGFDTLGLVTATAIGGKNGEGDSLADPSTKVEYDLFNWMHHRRPNYSRTLAREEHQKQESKWQESYSYTNGLGKETLTKVQAEAGMAYVRNADGSLKKENGKLVQAHSQKRWIGNGRTILNNKGKTVKQYEPYFSSTSAYEDEAELRELGVTPIIHYDPLERVIRTEQPDGTFSKTIFTPWEQKVYDPNDTILESDWYQQRGAPDPAGAKPKAVESIAAWLAAQHANTPTISHLDTLGRAFLAVEDNGAKGQYETHSELNISGQAIRITDPKGRQLSEETFDLLGNLVYSQKADAGERWAISSVLVEESEEEEEEALPYLLWDSLGHQFQYHYDALQRTHYTSLKKGGSTQITQLIIYGEQHPKASQENLKGQIYLQFDQAGIAKNHRFDFKGNLLKNSKRFAVEYKKTIDWSPLAAIQDAQQIETAMATFLQSEEFISQSSFDALNRPLETITPDQSLIKHRFNEANLLEQVHVRLKGAADWTAFVDRIDYDEKGQRTAIQYSNGVRSNYQYDPFNFRLCRLHTVRQSDQRSVQDLHYTYDAVGNICHYKDAAQEEVFFKNAEVKAEGTYEYDALYRLIKAEGRELAGNIPTTAVELQIQPLPHASNTKALRSYRQTYTYDELGNILQLAHQANQGNWRRNYQYANDSNRLLATSAAGDHEGEYSQPYTYDLHGNMLSMPHLNSMQWDFEDQLKEVDLGGGGKAWYVYDAAGERRRKVIERSDGVIQERYYLGSFEVYREQKSGSISLERQSLHITDNSGRIALVDHKTIDFKKGVDSTAMIRYQLSNHLGSATLEMDDKAAIISYEEYYPFGASAYRSGRSTAEASLKRYRYTGKERDEESGLYYYGARYYAAWLGRWTAADPAGFVDGLNVYGYVKNNPVDHVDPDGLSLTPSLNGNQLLLSAVLSNVDLKDWGTSGNYWTGLTAGLIDTYAKEFVSASNSMVKSSLKTALYTALGPIYGLVYFIGSGDANDLLEKGKAAFDIIFSGEALTMLSNAIKDAVGDLLSGIDAEAGYLHGKLLFHVLSSVMTASNIRTAVTKGVLPKNAAKKLRKDLISELSNEDFLQEVARRANNWGNRKGLLKGPDAGKIKHKYAERVVKRSQKRYGDRGLQVEFKIPGKGRSYSKPDVIDFRNFKIYDYKFGSAVMSKKQFLKYRSSIQQYRPDSIFEINTINPLKGVIQINK